MELFSDSERWCFYLLSHENLWDIVSHPHYEPDVKITNSLFPTLGNYIHTSLLALDLFWLCLHQCRLLCHRFVNLQPTGMQCAAFGLVVVAVDTGL